MARPYGDFFTASLAWAELGRPFGALPGISSARTLGVQRKMWDLFSPKREGKVPVPCYSFRYGRS